jgi:hypothetical protein
LSASDIKSCVNAESSRLDGQFTGLHGIIAFREDQRSFWSPWLHLELRHAQTGTSVFGRFSPHPSIWTGFVFSYLGLAVLMFFTVLFGVAQQLSGQPGAAYSLLLLWVGIAAVLWFVSQIGQNLAHVEMIELKKLVEASLASV